MKLSVYALVTLITGALAPYSYAQSWYHTFDDATHHADYAAAGAVDSAGSVVSVGTSANATNDIVLIKYAADGTLLWTRTYDGPAHLTDQAKAVVVDKDGNIYVGGTSYTSASAKEFILLKYNAAGTLQWAYTAAPGGNVNNFGGLGIDGNDNVYLAGSCAIGGGATNIVLIKIAPTEAVQWTKTYNFAAKADVAEALVVDTYGHSYLCGYSTNPSNRRRGLVMKHSADGTLNWKYFAYDAGKDIDLACIKIDASANVYSGGRIGTGTGTDAYTLKLTPSGVLSWAHNYDGDVHDFDSISDLAVDTHGDIYCVGATETGVDKLDELFVTYHNDGGLIYAQHVDGGAHDNDRAILATADSSGVVYTYSIRTKTGGTQDTMIRSIDQGGTFSTFTTPPHTSYQQGALFRDTHDNLLVTESVDTGGTTGNDIWTYHFALAPHTRLDSYMVNYAHTLNVSVANGVLANDAYADGATATLDSIPTHGTMSLQSNGALSFTPGAGFFGVDASATYHATRAGLTQSGSSIRLEIVPALASLTATPATLTGGQSSTATMTVNHVAGSTYVRANLTSSDPAVATVPAQCILSTGQDHGTFSITTHTVAVAKTVTITANWNGNTKTVTLTVNPG
jgi:hypothetical protein